MLPRIFLQLVNMSLTASFVILLVVFLRFLLKNTPKIFSYALWAVVLFRLVCPVSFESAVSVLPSAKPIPGEIITSENTANWAINSGIAAIDNVVNPLLYETSPAPMRSNLSIVAALWLAGAAVLFLFSLFSLVRLHCRLVGAVRYDSGVYLADSIPSPFVIGIVNPRIYLPSGLSDQEREYVLLHEKNHIRRGDHLIKILAFLALCVHWFNPLVWLAFYLSCEDMEMSCDEAVMRRMDTDIRRAYSASLLNLSAGRGIPLGTPLAFGEGNVKTRIKNVLHYKKPAFWVCLVAAVAVVAAAVGLLANPPGQNSDGILFPAYTDGKDENNAGVYNTAAFTLNGALPKGWSVQLPDEDDRGPAPNGFTPVYLTKDGAVMATVAFGTFEEYDGEIPPEDYYKMVYAPLRLGSLYRWDYYIPVATTDTAESALATVFVSQETPGTAAAAWPVVEYDGILAYDKTLGVYIAIQFEEGALGNTERIDFAKSISLTPAR